MCGLVGYFGVPSFKTTLSFSDLLQIDSLRGLDSTGVAFVPINKGEIKIIKELGPPIFLLNNKSYIEEIKSDNRVLIGHNRAATKGEINIDNAHPFQNGHIIGTHNGTLFNTYLLDSKKRFQTDSEAMFNSIFETGIEETWSKVDGAAAIVYWDNRKKELNFLRNDKRPLFYAKTKDSKGVFWASESWMILAISHRRNIEIQSIFYPLPNDLRIFNLRKGLIVEKSLKLNPFKQKYYNKYTNYSDFLGGNYGLKEYGKKEIDQDLNKSAAKKETFINKISKGFRENFDSVYCHVTDQFLLTEEFVLQYPFCFLCGVSLENEVEEATIIDDNKAACSDCLAVSKLDNIDIMRMR